MHMQSRLVMYALANIDSLHVGGEQRYLSIESRHIVAIIR